MRVCGSGDVRRRRLPCRSGKAVYWRAAPPLGHATTFAAARWRRAHRGPRRGTSSCRYRCRSRRSRYWLSETWRAPCLWRPLPASLAGGAGARPDHPISGLSSRYPIRVRKRACRSLFVLWRAGLARSISVCRMRNNPIIVQKYGGTCLETPAKIRAVASGLADLHRRGYRVVAIVSAIGKTTDELVKLAYQVSPHPNRRELDMLLTTGERISRSSMSMALADLGVPAISFTGSQAGVMTDQSHSSARILDVRPIRVREELDRGRIVVLAGFQGVNPVTKEITTLGRGGSDTTAVAMAAALKAECCEIIKEVDGVCSADPRIVANSKPLRELDFASLSEMCFWGAKVLHFRSVELAQSENVP